MQTDVLGAWIQDKTTPSEVLECIRSMIEAELMERDMAERALRSLALVKDQEVA